MQKRDAWASFKNSSYSLLICEIFCVCFWGHISLISVYFLYHYFMLILKKWNVNYQNLDYKDKQTPMNYYAKLANRLHLIIKVNNSLKDCIKTMCLYWQLIKRYSNMVVCGEQTFFRAFQLTLLVLKTVSCQVRVNESV